MLGSKVQDRLSGRKNWWISLPLYGRILIGLGLGVACGIALGPRAVIFDVPTQLILRVLGALAPPLVLLGVVRALLTVEIRGRLVMRMIRLLLLNTLVAISVGLAIAKLFEPGKVATLKRPDLALSTNSDVLGQLLNNIPRSLLEPFVENQVIGVVLIAVAFGMAARKLHGEERLFVERLFSAGFQTLLLVLSWAIALVPLAVFGKVASVVGSSGFAPFKALLMFVVAVLTALLVQALYYLVRIRTSSWVPLAALLKSTRDALTMAFSTASSLVTMPVTYACLKRLGLRERSASLGALVGSNFNNDGTALYEAMAALFVAQLLGMNLTFEQQILVVLTSVVASVGAAGIPEAGLVTMTLVFNAVSIPVEYIALLLTVDWFLDRCRTTVNVMGDINVACLLDGLERDSTAGLPRDP
jgi:Na+/H+-dicarboxylate symporter